MKNRLMELVEEAGAKKEVPEFTIGDQVEVHQRILEGEKERVQVFAGVVIARKGEGLREMFTVRRIVQGEGVERMFPLHSPKIAKVEVKRSGEVRRAKLYYLRDRVGKATRLRERRGKGEAEMRAKGAKKAKPAEAKAEERWIEVVMSSEPAVRAPWWRRWFGSRAERAAARFLKRLGYRIVARNWTSALGELDLVALDGTCVVFVEVRSTGLADTSQPAGSVDEAKQRRLTRLALSFLQKHQLLDRPARFDVLAVSWPAGRRQPEIAHHRQAFDAVGRFQMFT